MAENEPQVFEEVLAEHKEMIWRICSGYLIDPEDRADLFQEIATNLWLKLHTFRGESALSTWIFRVATNTALLFRKKEERHRQVPIEAADRFQVTVSYEESELSEKREHLLATLHKLPQVEPTGCDDAFGRYDLQGNVRSFGGKRFKHRSQSKSGKEEVDHFNANKMNLDELKETWKESTEVIIPKTTEVSSNMWHSIDGMESKLKKTLGWKAAMTIFMSIYLTIIWQSIESVVWYTTVGYVMVALVMAFHVFAYWVTRIEIARSGMERNTYSMLKHVRKQYQLRARVSLLGSLVYGVLLGFGIFLGTFQFVSRGDWLFQFSVYGITGAWILVGTIWLYLKQRKNLEKNRFTQYWRRWKSFRTGYKTRDPRIFSRFWRRVFF